MFTVGWCCLGWCCLGWCCWGWFFSRSIVGFVFSQDQSLGKHPPPATFFYRLNYGVLQSCLQEAGVVCAGLEDVVGSVRGFLKAQAWGLVRLWGGQHMVGMRPGPFALLCLHNLLVVCVLFTLEGVGLPAHSSEHHFIQVNLIWSYGNQISKLGQGPFFDIWFPFDSNDLNNEDEGVWQLAGQSWLSDRELSGLRCVLWGLACLSQRSRASLLCSVAEKPCP